MSDDPYVYPGTRGLRNRLRITDATELERIERLLTTQRAASGVPSDDLDLAHMRAIHSHLFSRVYSRAGKVRTVETSKGGHQFMFRKYIGNGMADVHRRILAANYFIGANVADFAEGVGRIIGEGNYVHPFR